MALMAPVVITASSGKRATDKLTRAIFVPEEKSHHIQNGGCYDDANTLSTKPEADH